MKLSNNNESDASRVRLKISHTDKNFFYQLQKCIRTTAEFYDLIKCGKLITVQSITTHLKHPKYACYNCVVTICCCRSSRWYVIFLMKNSLAKPLLPIFAVNRHSEFQNKYEISSRRSISVETKYFWKLQKLLVSTDMHSSLTAVCFLYL